MERDSVHNKTRNFLGGGTKKNQTNKTTQQQNKQTLLPEFCTSVESNELHVPSAVRDRLHG